MRLFDESKKSDAPQGEDSHAEKPHDAKAHADDHEHEDGDHAHDEAGHAEDGHDHGDVTAMDHFMDPSHLFGHVQDSHEFHVPKFMGEHWEIPNVLGFVGVTKEVPLIGTAEKPIIKGRLTKFMVLELVGAILIAVVFIWLARKIKSGEKPKGKIWNLLETFVVFIRDEIARPTIGSKDADRFLPFLLSLFFFILVLNLFGMIPFLGSATAALAVTAVFALVTFAVVIGVGVKKMGVVGFAKAQVPHMELPKALALVLIPSIWLIEIFGLFVKHFVLAIRLFANMFAGHLVLSVFLAFIGATAGTMLGYFVGPAVVLGSVALSLLELFVAFLQAYVFTFLASLFIGSAVHPH
ncbi:MAG: F0F1 ATP synthase subunit A [Mariniblastus sp.]